MDQDNTELPTNRRSFSKQREIYRCPHCPKKYKTSTWLTNHIMVKHSTRDDQEQPEISTNLGSVRSQSSQESQCSVLVKDLQTMSAQLKQFIPLIQDAVPLLQILEEISPRSDWGHLHSRMRSSSSLDLNDVENISTCSPEASLPRGSNSVRSSRPGTQLAP